MNPGFEFLNLEGACPAEKEILQSIIRNTVNSKGLFCFETPFSVDDETRGVHTEFGQGEGAVTLDPVIEDNSSVSAPVVSVETTELQTEPNGTMLSMSPHQHVNPSTVTSHAISAFYPGQPPMAVAVSGAGGHVPSLGPNTVHNPVSGNQMMMFAQPMSQMIQTHAGFYPPHYYAPPPAGAQSHLQFVGQPSEAMSPDGNYLPPGQMSHHKHDSHHSSHPSSNTNQGIQTQYGKSRRKQQPPQQQQSYYYTTTAPYYGNMQFYNQQLAQNVTGPPIIMAGPAGMFQYPPHQHQTHHGVYGQGPPGNDMEHHPGSLPHAMGPIVNEMTFAQHHPSGPNNPHVYSHSSPTHSNPNPRTTYAPLNNTSSARNAHSISDQANSSGDSITENGSPTSANEHQTVLIASSTSIVEVPNASIVFNGNENSKVEETLLSNINRDSYKQDTELPPKSPKSVASTAINGETKCAGITVDDVGAEPVHSPEGVSVSNTKIDTLSQSSNILVKDFDSVQSIDTDSGSVGVKIESSSLKPILVNGGVDTSNNNDSSSDKLSTKCRDISADLETSTLSEGDLKTVSSKQSCDTKSKGQAVVSVSSSSNLKSQNVEVGSAAANGGSSNDLKVIDDGSCGEFPNLNETATSANSSEMKKAPEPSNTKTWASIASVKSNIPMDGATALRSSQSSFGGGSMSINNHDSYYKAADQFVPMQQDERDNSDLCFDASRLTDENDPVAIRLGEHLQKYNLDHRSIPLSPRGLCNQSNYCFLNATLQALLACPTFVNLFQSLTPILSRAPCKATPIIQNVFSFVSEFQPVTRGSNLRKDRMRDSLNVGPSFEPTGIRKCLGLLEGETFKVEGRQEDAEEFLSHLLNGLHDEMIKVIKWSECKKERTERGLQPPITAVVNGTGTADFEETNEDEDDSWQVMGARNKSCVTRKTAITKSPISEAFLGQMCSSLSRANSIKSATLQPFYTLQLDIQNDNIRSVRDALESISTKEEVSGLTSSTGSEVEAWRQLSLEELPPVLILHLKRFVYEKNGNRIHKIDKKLDFGVDLEIGKELLSNNSKKFTLKQRQYKLFAVVYHDGEEAHKGHYVADCFHPLAGTQWGQWGWLRYDDTSVKQISEAYMLNPQPPRVPYLLYYRRQDTIILQTKKERSS